MKNKTNRNKRTNKRTKTKMMKKLHNGGKIIGKGISGTVHYPALQCKNPSENPKGESKDIYVSKVSTKKSAEKEFELTSKLRELKNASDFSVFPEYMCEYNEKQNLLFSRFGGHSLVNYYTHLEDLAYSNSNSKNSFDNEFYNNVIKALKILKDKVKYMNDNNIYQGDISFDNILYNEDEKKIYLIDFERGGKKKDETKDVQSLINDLEDFHKRIFNNTQ